MQLAMVTAMNVEANGWQAPRLPLARHNRCIMSPPAGRLRSSIRAARYGFGARCAARTVSSAPTVSDDANTPNGACADDTVLGCAPSR